MVLFKRLKRNQVNKMPLLKKPSTISNTSYKTHSRPNSTSRRSNVTIDLSLDEMIDVINLVDYELKGEQTLINPTQQKSPNPTAPMSAKLELL